MTVRSNDYWDGYNEGMRASERSSAILIAAILTTLNVEDVVVKDATVLKAQSALVYRLQDQHSTTFKVAAATPPDEPSRTP